MNEHFRRLERLYRSAPIHQLYPDFEFKLRTEKCEIITKLGSNLNHGGGSLHGSIYFKLMDDCAYFAAMTVESEFFIVTSKATIEFLRPIADAEVIASATLIAQKENEYEAEAELWRGNKIAGKGRFSFKASKIKLSDIEAYASPL